MMYFKIHIKIYKILQRIIIYKITMKLKYQIVNNLKLYANQKNYKKNNKLSLLQQNMII